MHDHQPDKPYKYETKQNHNYPLFKEFEENIIILSEEKRDFIKSEVESVLGNIGKTRKKKKINLIIKDGNPLLRGNLEDISIEKACAIAVMAREDLEAGENIKINSLYK